MYRAVVADHANGKITVIDASSGKIIANYGVEGPARLKANESGRIVYLTQGGQNRVDALDTGVTVRNHGDHADVEMVAPRMTASSLLGTKPSHINMDGGRVAAFFDGEGQALVTREDAFLNGKFQTSRVRTAAPHHGLAAPLADLIAVSIPNPAEEKGLPIGIDLQDKNGKSVARSVDCPRMHGEGRSGSFTAFGCADGVLLLRKTHTGSSFEKLHYPAKLPADRMVRNMAGAKGTTSFLADFGADGMVVIDPTTKDFNFVPLGAKRMHFARDRIVGDFGFVITEDGQLHKVNALTGKIDASIAVTERYSMDGGSQVPRPRLSASGERVVITDPAKAKVHIVDSATMRVTHTVAVPGAPFDVVVVGATGGDH